MEAKLTKVQNDIISSLKKKGYSLVYYKRGSISNSKYQLEHISGGIDKVNGKTGYALIKSGLLIQSNKIDFTQYSSNITYIINPAHLLGDK